jgi:hypothetical protein
MHIWTDIVVRELVMLVTLAAIGSGPASYLGRRFDAAARVALAPVLGLCLGTCIFTTLIWFTTARHTYWLVPVIALASLAIALRRAVKTVPADGHRSRTARTLDLLKRLPARDAVALAVVCVVVAAPLSYTLRERHSVGPIGFEVWDAVGYTGETDGMEQESIRQAAHEYSQPAVSGYSSNAARAEALSRASFSSRENFVRLFWNFYAAGDQNLDAAPISANMNELLGLHATDTQGLYLIVFLVVGGLGAFGAMRYAASRPFWVAPLAGVLFAGPLFLQLVVDGSQAAILGLSVILPFIAAGADAVRERTVASLALFALLAAGLAALYPLFVAMAALSAVIVLLFLAGRAWRGRQLSRRVLIGTLRALALVVVLSIALDVVAFTRDVRYWHAILNGSFFQAGLPKYYLPVSVLPGWLLQTREFYSLTDLAHSSAHQLVLGIVIPLIFLAAIVAGLIRRRGAFVLLPFVVVASALALYVSQAHNCSYCADRNLIAIGPLSIGLLGIAVASLATARSHWLRWMGVILAALVVVSVAARSRQERLRFSDGAYFLDASNRALLLHRPPHSGIVDLETYGADPGRAPGEQPLVYYLVSEQTDGEVSVPSEYVENAALAYLGETNPGNPQFSPNYRYVLTRLGGVQNGRRVIAHTGSVALEERSEPLDTTVVTGVAVPLLRQDAQGFGLVEGPLHLLVSGEAAGPVWVSLRFLASVPVTVPRQPGVSTRLEPRGVLAACVRTIGGPPVRKATITLSFPHTPGLLPAEPYAVSEPPEGVQLVAMRAVRRCPIAGAGSGGSHR